VTSKERVLASLRHSEPDRVPIDLGGMDSTGITAVAYNRLKKHLGIEGGTTRIYDPYQQVVKVEESVLEAIGGDVLPVIREPRVWKPAVLADGSDCEIPERWNPIRMPDGSQAVKDARGAVIAVMPSGGYYFEPVNPPLEKASSVADVEACLDVLENFDWPDYCDEDFVDLRQKAAHLFDNTDYALFGNFAVHIFAAGQLLRGTEQFMVDLAEDSAIAHYIMDRLVDVYIRRFDDYNLALGQYIQIINVNDDLGAQNGLMISPAMYRRSVKPYQERLYRHIKETSDLFLFLHSDGSVYDVIPDLIEMGVDILNPVQFNCRNMELERLKREFGKDISFWGGGCDTQNILPYAKPGEVREHVTKCVATLAPGGGFVFNQLHNIQPDVPSENITAMYEAVKEWRYGAV